MEMLRQPFADAAQRTKAFGTKTFDATKEILGGSPPAHQESSQPLTEKAPEGAQEGRHYGSLNTGEGSDQPKPPAGVDSSTHQQPALERQGRIALTKSIVGDERHVRQTIYIAVSIAIAGLLTFYGITTCTENGSAPTGVQLSPLVHPYVVVVWFVVGIYLGHCLSSFQTARSSERRERSHVALVPITKTTIQAYKPEVNEKKRGGWFESAFKTRRKTSSTDSVFDSSISTWFSDSFIRDQFTTLKDRGVKAYWEKHISDKPSNQMTSWLLRSDFKTRSSTGIAANGIPDVDLETGSAPDELAESGNDQFGTFDTDSMHASVMHRTVQSRQIAPLFALRGMDIFRTVGCPEEKIFRQPILDEGGLRDLPTFVVNFMLPFANLVLYFEMPEWVKSFDDIPDEEGNDPHDIVALKRFLRGDAAYRRPRWKILASVVDGPWVVRSLAPPTGEIVLDFHNWLPLTWHHQNEGADAATGKVRKALLSVDVDSMSDKTARKMLSLVQGSIGKVKVDCAVVISKPTLSEKEEPSACIGLWRMDRIDMHKTSLLPEKDEEMLVEECPEGCNAKI